jgi:hypothetical protein
VGGEKKAESERKLLLSAEEDLINHFVEEKNFPPNKMEKKFLSRFDDMCFKWD